MGYSARYHVASLAAVFIALAIGILIGAALGSDVVSGTAENLEEGLSEDIDRIRAENADLSDELDFERSFSEELVPAVVANRLAGQEIALIGLGDIDTETLTSDVEAALARTGSELTEVATVREPPDAEALEEGLLSDRQRRRGEGLEGAAERAGRMLAGRGGELGNLRGTLLAEFSGSSEGLDAAVVARARPDDLSPRELNVVEQLERGLIRGLRGAGLRVVGAEREDTDPSSIEFFGAQDLATVDSIDQLPGKVALVLALDGSDGDFGVKETADRLLPELIRPSGALGPGADGAAG